MSTELVKKELTQIEKDILEVISTSEISSAREIANMLDIPESKVIAILNNDEFYNLVCANSLSNMRLAYHSKAIPHLIKDLDTEVKFYDSYDRLTKAIGAVKERDNESLKVSLEVLLKEKKEEKNVTPHIKSENILSGNIFEIQDSSKKEIPHNKLEFDFEFEEE